MPDGERFLGLGISLGLGLLVGLQRERAGSAIAGIRTFSLITLLGSLCAILADRYGVWIPAAGLVSVAVMALVGNLVRARRDESPGVTTETAMLLMFMVGVMVVTGPVMPAVAVGVVAAVLLQAKGALQGIVARLGEQDINAIMQFAAITLVVLPVLPDKAYGPFEVLNPHRIWWMVVLVVGMSLLGYVAYRLLGDRRGTVLAGLLGGMISSTATTVSFSRAAREAPGSARIATLAIMLASCVLYVRLLVEVFATAREHFWQIMPPILIMGAVSVTLAIIAGLLARDGAVPVSPHANPTELRSALLFAGLYGLVLLASAAAKHYFGEAGTYGVAALSGLTDMDAITLSSSRMAADGHLTPAQASRAIVIAAMSNTAFKAGTIAAIGGTTLWRRVFWMLGVKVLAGALLVWWW